MILSKWVIGDLISVGERGRLYDGCYLRKETDYNGEYTGRHHVAILDNSSKGVALITVNEKQIGSPVIGYHKNKIIEGYEGEF